MVHSDHVNFIKQNIVHREVILTDKIKILTISDHPLSPSGVGLQTKYMITAMLDTGKYKFISLGGAVKHNEYGPQKTEEYGDEWVILPVDGYGTADVVRSIIRNEKPDILWFMTDPRFYGWLWDIENEIRPLIPMVYYHVWDNIPYPRFNKPYYESNDLVVTISKVTQEILENVAPDVESVYLPHAVNTEIFKKHPKQDVTNFKIQSYPDDRGLDKFTFFWNNRNARRKMSGSVLWWFKEFLDQVGRDNARLIMHTDPKDPYGQDLEVIIKELGITNGEIMLSKEKYSMEILSMLYNMADCTINVSDAEGFGLATFESLACETPIIVNMTGGLQEQVTDGKDWFGIGIEPASKALIGSQDVPYIWEDRVCKKDFIEALTKMYNMTTEEREELGRKGRQHVLNNYGYKNFVEKWDKLLTGVYEKHGSWDKRKGYESWRLEAVK